jgi:hypothetical protein
MTTLDLERSMQSLIRQAVDDAPQPDSTVIAKKIMDDLDSEQLLQLAESGVRYCVRTYLSAQRHVEKETRKRSNGSARWDAVKAEVASGELDLARYSVFTGETRKWLLDCNVADLHGAASWHRDRGDSYYATAEAMDGLAKTLKQRKGAEVVGDLPEQKVRGLLNA